MAETSTISNLEAINQNSIAKQYEADFDSAKLPTETTMMNGDLGWTGDYYDLTSGTSRSADLQFKFSTTHILLQTGSVSYKKFILDETNKYWVSTSDDGSHQIQVREIDDPAGKAHLIARNVLIQGANMSVVGFTSGAAIPAPVPKVSTP